MPGCAAIGTARIAFGAFEHGEGDRVDDDTVWGDQGRTVPGVVEDGGGECDNEVAVGRDDTAGGDGRLGAPRGIVVDAPATYRNVCIGRIVQFDPFGASGRGRHDFVDE